MKAVDVYDGGYNAGLAAAIANAEEGTTGRIAVRVIPDASVDAFERAKREFAKAGLHRHEHANAALILVAPKARRFAVIGDRALHEKVGDDFWNDLVRESEAQFKNRHPGNVFDGILAAVQTLGKAFHEHFPA